jgi:hypothetical protein
VAALRLSEDRKVACLDINTMESELARLFGRLLLLSYLGWLLPVDFHVVKLRKQAVSHQSEER